MTKFSTPYEWHRTLMRLNLLVLVVGLVLALDNPAQAATFPVDDSRSTVQDSSLPMQWCVQLKLQRDQTSD